MTQEGSRKHVSLKKAVDALETLLSELDTLPGKELASSDKKEVDGLRKQVEGMVLMMKGACGRRGQEDFAFPGE